jgi:hypothetical protein
MALIDQTILNYIAAHPGVGRDEIQRAIMPQVSAPTIWRALKRLVGEGKLEMIGKGRATSYVLVGAVTVRSYLQTPYNRRKSVNYNREFIDRYIPNKTFYLSVSNREQLYTAGKPQHNLFPAGTYARRILEKLLVDLSWASSRLEGNTYNILETEQLIRFGHDT